MGAVIDGGWFMPLRMNDMNDFLSHSLDSNMFRVSPSAFPLDLPPALSALSVLSALSAMPSVARFTDRNLLMVAGPFGLGQEDEE